MHKQRVRIIDMDDQTTSETSLDGFLRHNDLTKTEVRRICEGKLVQFGGGAQPWIAVQLVAKPIAVPKSKRR